MDTHPHGLAISQFESDHSEDHPRQPLSLPNQHQNPHRNMHNKIIGEYIMRQTLGQGVYGKVKLATHIPTNTTVAIKIMAKRQIYEMNMQARIRQEISILKQLTANNNNASGGKYIMQYKHVMVSDRNIYLVMEYVQDARDLEYWVVTKKIRGDYDWDVGNQEAENQHPNGNADQYNQRIETPARYLFQQLIDALIYVHDRGVYHRDIKPHNILVDPTDQLKLIDFSVSCISQSREREQPTLFKTYCGSPFFAPPEIMVMGRRERQNSGRSQGYQFSNYYDPSKVDSWSVGVILYFLLTGKLPFVDSSQEALIAKVCAAEPEYPAFLPEGAKDLISRLLMKDPQQRISVHQVKRHKWFLTSYRNSSKDLLRSS